MLNSLDVRNFQSLKSAHLELGLITVIVGDSNCGKSAVIRALGALSSNVRGSSVITHGAKAASVTATTDTHKITLEKAESGSSYRTSEIDGSDDREYTKLAGEVPEDVSKLLGLDPVKDGASLTFAAQHDAPFLLTSSGSAAARTLGELTSVNKVLDAVREANRQRTAASSALKLRKKDLEESEKKLTEFESLKARRDALLKAKLLLLHIEKCEEEVQDLGLLLFDIDISQAVKLPVSVDTTEVEEAHGYFSKLYSDLKTYKDAVDDLASATAGLANCEESWNIAHSAFDRELKEAGQCPMCGNQTSL